MTKTKPNRCGTCRFYYLTWDRKAPYGCRAFNFKSRRLPSIVVLQSSGAQCLRYQEKDPTSSKKNK